MPTTTAKHEPVPGFLREILKSDTVDEDLKGLLGKDYNPTARYYISSDHFVARRLKQGWTATGIRDGELQLLTRKDT
jgi:hypothetical protein